MTQPARVLLWCKPRATELFTFAGSLLLALAALGSLLKELHRRRTTSRKRKREQVERNGPPGSRRRK